MTSSPQARRSRPARPRSGRPAWRKSTVSASRGGQSAGTLSGGTQQKLNLALAQIDSPDLLLLDEPYQGFDSLAYEDLWGLVEAWRSGGAGVLLVTHLLRDLDHVDRVIELPSPERPEEVAS